MPETEDYPRETIESIRSLQVHHRSHVPWGSASEVIVQLCGEILLLMTEKAELTAERDEARRVAESLHLDERRNMGRHSEYGPLPWQYKTCPTCGGDGRDTDHHGVRILMDMDAIICDLHGEVGNSRQHGMCDACKGSGKISIESTELATTA